MRSDTSLFAADGESALFHFWRESRGGDLASMMVRDVAVRSYSWAVLDRAALAAIVAASPGGIVEIGAGMGYNAALLAEMGADVVAYDAVPCSDRWFNVELGGPEVLAWHPDRTLLLCWPPYNTSMAADCLARYRGNTVVYVGEDEYGATADDAFFRRLEAEWQQTQEISIPTWLFIEDYLGIYQRVS